MAVKKNTNGKKPVKKPDPEVVHGEPVESSIILSKREAPIERVLDKADIINSVYNEAQLRILLNRTPKWAIKVREGPGGSYKYVPHGYVTDQLNKAFGFNWDIVNDPIEVGNMYAIQFVTTDKNGKVLDFPKRYVAVAGHITVRVFDPKTRETYTITKSGFGSQEWLPGQEFGDALKGANSDLVKVCAYRLGVALDLYWDEKAEYDEYTEVQRKKEERRRARDIMEQMQNQNPSTPILLLSRAMSDYQMDGEAIAEVIGLDDPDEIMLLNTEAVAEAWTKITEYQEEQKAVEAAKSTKGKKK